MIRKRIIPTLLLKKDLLVKTINFKNDIYIGDPLNTIKIFNDLEVDELIILDISVDYKKKIEINYDYLRLIASECFMPLSYGGGISNIVDAERIFRLGFEKIIINSHGLLNKNLINELVKKFGSQAIIISIDVKKTIFGKYKIYIHGGQKKINIQLFDWIKEIENIGVGEVFITNIDKEGTWSGYDFELIKQISDILSVPIIAHGGCGSIDDIKKVFDYSNASAAAVGSMFVFQKKEMGVLINFLTTNEVERIFRFTS